MAVRRSRRPDSVEVPPKRSPSSALDARRHFALTRRYVWRAQANFGRSHRRRNWVKLNGERGWTRSANWVSMIYRCGVPGWHSSWAPGSHELTSFDNAAFNSLAVASATPIRRVQSASDIGCTCPPSQETRSLSGPNHQDLFPSLVVRSQHADLESPVTRVASYVDCPSTHLCDKPVEGEVTGEDAPPDHSEESISH